MSNLATFISSKKIKPQTILNKSAALEAHGLEDLDLVAKRAAHRAKNQNGNYGEASLAKPKSGRGLSKAQLDTLLAGGASSKRARAKLVRVLAAISGTDAAELKKMVAPVPPKKEKAADAE